MSNKNFDTCVSFQLEGGAFIGRMVRLNEVVNTILTKHQYPTDVSAALAETSALSVLLSAALKYKGLFTLQIQGNGPVSLLVADVTSEHKVRACAKYDEQKLLKAKELRKTQDSLEPLPHLVGGGHMAFTIDQGPETDLYQGIVDLKGKTLTELALRYFKQSEQIDTALKLFLKVPQGESSTWQSAGILVQKVPLKGGKDIDFDEENQKKTWEDLTVFVQSLKDDEVFDANLSSSEILYRLFHGNDLSVQKEQPYTFGCRCSRDKLFSTLSGFPKNEIDEMLDQDQKITATCHFCSETYVFDKAEFSKN